MDRKEILLDYVRKQLLHGGGENLTAQEDMLSAGIIDSLGISQLVAFIEEHFKIKIPDEDVVYDNFYCINALSEYLDKY